MYKCDLTIETEKRSFQPGERVRGQIHVDVDGDCRCDVLSIDLGWRTHGKGNEDSGDIDRMILGPFEWKAGERQSYHFVVTMPDGPVTYHGHLINVDWYLTARADIPWALDPKAETDVILEPLPAERRAPDTYRGPPRTEARPHDVGHPAMPQIGPEKIAMAGIFVVVAMVGMMFTIRGGLEGFDLLVIAFMTFGVGRIVWRLSKNSVAKQALGRVDLQLTPGWGTRGEAVAVAITIEPAKEAVIQGIEVELVAKESATRGSGTNKRTFHHTVHQHRVRVGQGTKLTPGEPHVVHAEVKLPQDAPPTFRGGDNRLRWSVIGHIDIPRWPDVAEQRELTVQPS